MAKQYVWNSEKEEFELVDVYEGVLAEFDRQDKAPAQHKRAADVCQSCGAIDQFTFTNIKDSVQACLVCGTHR